MTTQETELVLKDDEWESGDLGKNEKHVRKSSPERVKSVDDALGLQMISLRLPKELLDQLKWIANYYHVGYQPLSRDVLGRWARREIMTIAEQIREELAAKEAIESAKTLSKKRA